MSTILSRRNITVQDNIERIEDIEDMRNFLICLHTIQKTQSPLIVKPMASIPSTDVFYQIWNQISSQTNLNRFTNSYNISKWACRVTDNSIYVYITTSYDVDTPLLQQRNIFTLISFSDNRYRLVVSEEGVRGIKFDKICDILKCIEGVKMQSRQRLVKTVTGYDVASFDIDFNKL